MNETTQFDPQVIQALEQGDIEIDGQFMWGSNYTFLVNILQDGHTTRGVYKPIQGEKPLWDFPADSLAGREVAAYLVSAAGGWHLVPPTVLRDDGPIGPGSLQAYIEHDPNKHFFNFSAAQREATRTVALFDVIINNTDRKGGHLILARDDQRLWLIDHGICFHAQPKLRTVIWDFAGQPLTGAECEQLNALKDCLAQADALAADLEPYLSKLEILAITYRINQSLKAGVFPHPTEDRYSYPWPPV